MSEITITQLIKIIIGLVVVVAVVVGAYFIFKDKIFGFFDTISVNDTLPQIIGGLLL